MNTFLYSEFISVFQFLFLSDSDNNRWRLYPSLGLELDLFNFIP